MDALLSNILLTNTMKAMFSKIGPYCVMLGLLLALLACQDASNDSAVETNHPLSPQAIKIIPEEIALLDNDAPVNLVAVALDEHGDALETQPAFTWLSTDESVATVTAEGELRAMKEGRAMIKVITQGIENQISVAIYHSGIRLTFSEAPLLFRQLGDQQQLNVHVTDEQGESLVSLPELQWSTSNETVIDVNHEGLLTAIGDGRAVISVMANGFTKTLDVFVYSGEIHVSVLAGTNYLGQIGSQTLLSAQVNMANGERLAIQPKIQWQSKNTQILTVDENGLVSAVADGSASIVATAYGVSGQLIMTVNSSPVNISGIIRYQDREYSVQGGNRSKQIFKPVRFALVDLVSSEGRILQTVSTDNAGRFVFTPVISNPYTIRVIAKTDEQSGYAFEVNDLSGNLYAVTQTVDITNSTPDVQMDIDHGSTAAAAFNILDVFVIGGQFVNTLVSDRVPALAAYWQPNNSRGTYFCTNKDSFYCQQGAGIYVYNEGTFGDTDEFDDDVLWHEFGHFVAAHFSKDDSQGGCHLLSSNDLDLRLSWSEGWGDFFPAAIKSWLAVDEQRSQLLSVAEGISSTTYIDTAGNSALIAMDIAAVGNTTYIYASSEISIARILWDIVQEKGMQAVWDVFYHQLPSTSTPINLEAFWDGWLVQHNPDLLELQAIENIFQGRQVFYAEDRYEFDNEMSNIRKIGLGREETHTLYQADGESDVDILAFDGYQGVSYTVEAFNLRNGADTYLKVLPPDDNNLTMNATVVMDNDDQFENAYHTFDALCGESRVKNNASALSSKVTFVANSTGTYTVHVSTTPDPEPYLSAGRYGGYTIKISSQ